RVPDGAHGRRPRRRGSPGRIPAAEHHERRAGCRVRGRIVYLVNPSGLFGQESAGVAVQADGRIVVVGRFEDEAGTQSYFSERRSGDCGRVASPLDGRKGPSPLSPRPKCRPFTAKWFRDPGQGRTTASREILAQPHFQCALRYISWPSKVLTPFRPTLYNQDKLATPGRPVGRKFPVNRS